MNGQGALRVTPLTRGPAVTGTLWCTMPSLTWKKLRRNCMTLSMAAGGAQRQAPSRRDREPRRLAQAPRAPPRAALRPPWPLRCPASPHAAPLGTCGSLGTRPGIRAWVTSETGDAQTPRSRPRTRPQGAAASRAFEAD